MGVQRMRADVRVEEVDMQRTMVATLKFTEPSTYVLDLENARVKGVAGTLRFAKPSMQVLGLANPRVERVAPPKSGMISQEQRRCVPSVWVCF